MAKASTEDGMAEAIVILFFSCALFVFTGTMGDFQEPSVSTSLDKDLVALVPKANTSDHTYVIEALGVLHIFFYDFICF